VTTLQFTLDSSDEMVITHEQYLVPAIYAQWAGRVADIAEIDLGQHILDVACGTGTLARAARLETGLTGKVVGLDLNPMMLEVAHARNAGIEWKLGDATSMPFEKNQFDRVMCQFGLMFISNRVALIKEMLRVCKPDGLVLLATWGALHHGGAFETLIDLANKHSGPRVAKKLSAPWTLGKPGVMDALLLSSGVNEYECHQRIGLASYPSIRAFIEAHLRLAGEFDKINEQALRDIWQEAETKMQPFLSTGGQLVAQLNANIYAVKDI